MSKLLGALQRSCKSVMASAGVLALTALAITVPGTLHASDFHSEGNGHGKNTEYPYGVNQHSSAPTLSGCGATCRIPPSRIAAPHGRHDY